MLHAQMFMIRRAQGRLGELLPAVLEAVERHPALGAWRAALPPAHLAAGDERQARTEHDRTLDGLDAIPRDFFWRASMTLLAEATAAMRATGAAERLYGELVPFATRWVQIGYTTSDGPVARSLGLLAAARGDAPRAAAHFEQALRLCTLAGAAAFEARARADLAPASLRMVSGGGRPACRGRRSGCRRRSRRRASAGRRWPRMGRDRRARPARR